jgi:hypothetical protein
MRKLQPYRGARPLVVGSLAWLVLVAGCATANVRVPPPRSAKIVNSPQQRILVAGFVADPHDRVDVNGETVRLVRAELRKQGATRVIDADPLLLSTELEFRNTAFWRMVGEEYRAALIVTGSVNFRRASPQITPRGGRAGAYLVRPGFSLETDVILIDGSTGHVLSAERLPRKVHYGSGRRAAPAFMYSTIMNSVVRDLVKAVIEPGSISR